jgi:hypothetical protein
MADISDILAWKFSDAEGIETVDGVIAGWPASLGSRPTDAEMSQYSTEYDAKPASREETLKAKSRDDWTDSEMREIIEILLQR